MTLTLRADRTRRLAFDQLGQAGVEVILLKGPTLQWAWTPTPRAYTDVDILVPPHQHAAAVEVMAAAGFAVRPTLIPSFHATTLDRVGDAPVDLHWTLPMSEVSALETWVVLRRHSRTVDGEASWLDRPAAAAVAILHAAQSRRGMVKLEQDVATLVSDLDIVRQALALADELGARRAFALGLSITPAGVTAIEALGVDPPTAAAVAKHAAVQRTEAVLVTLRRRGPRAVVRLLWPRRSDLPHQSDRPLWRSRRLVRAVRSSLGASVRGRWTGRRGTGRPPREE